MLRAHDSLFTLGGVDATAYLDDGLTSLRKAMPGYPDWDAVIGMEADHVSAGGIGMLHPLKGDVAFMHDCILRESLFCMLHDFIEKERPLPVAAQQYILQHMPEWVVIQPQVFNQALAESLQPGLFHTAICLHSLPYSADERVEAFKTWLETNRAGLGITTDHTALPELLM